MRTIRVLGMGKLLVLGDGETISARGWGDY